MVDDQPDVRLAFKYMLEQSGCEIAEASSGAEALARLREQHMDVLLTDLSMPGMNGWELLRQVRESPPPHPVTIAFTGEARGDTQSAIDDASRTGADAVLPKPLSRDRLMGTIRRLLNIQGAHPG